MKKVLMVDDDKFTHELVRRMVDEYGYDIELHNAYTALEAFEEIRTGEYDIALVDQKIDVMQGSDVIRSLKHLRFKTDIYIFTGYEKEYVEFQVRDLKGFIKGIIHKNDMEKAFGKLFENKNA